MTKIRLTNCVGSNFALRSIDRVKDSELNQVEIMLVDILPDSGKMWLGAEKLARMPRLKFIQSLRAGVDAIDFEQIPSNVKICGNIGAYSDPIAEHAMGMILYLAKDLGGRNSKLKIGIMEHRSSLFLRGKTIGVVGAGGIGQAVARIARCFGMKTIGVNTSGKPVPNFDQTVGMRNLGRVLKASDVIVLSLPLTTKSFQLIDRSKLQLMKKNCILVNLGRGYVIDEEALYNHLVQNPEFRCGLDVWWHYPKANDKFSQRFSFLELPNFLGTPHISGNVAEEPEVALDFAVDNIVRFVKRKPLKGVVNREDYSGLQDLVRGSIRPGLSGMNVR
jgi:phosphoglycerate dehydrogenase-like enzyme